MANTKLDGLFTPGGRLVMGSLTERQDKDQQGAPIPVEDQAYFFAVAVPKSSPEVGPLVNQLWQMAATDYASMPLVMAQINMGLAATQFSWKIEDGDAPQVDPRTGLARQTPEYMKGCFIFKFRTKFEIGACDATGRDIARTGIKRGDYIDVMFNSQINGKVDHTAGIYLNPVAIRLLGYGEAIQSGVQASQAFAGRGAATMGSQMPTAAGAAMPAAALPGAPAMGMPAQQPAMGMPVGPTGMPGNAAPVQPVMVPAGGTAMPGMPGAAGTASPSNPGYPGILAGGGMPGM